MTLLRLLALTFLVFGLPKALLAINPNTQLSQYAHTAWRVEDGLLDGPPRSIAQTKDGYIWIGTEAGVLRFDGVRFTPLESVVGTNLGLAGNVWSLFGASDGSLWIGANARLLRWDGEKLSTFVGRAGRFSTVLEDRSGGIWAVRSRALGERDGGLCRPSGKAITCIGGSAQFFSSFTATIDPDNNIWSASSSAIVRYSSGKFTSFPFPFDSLHRAEGLGGVTAMAPDLHGGLWVDFVGSGISLGLAHLKDGNLKSLHTSAIDGKAIGANQILAEKDGTLWIGTIGDGLLRISGENVERYNPTNGLSGDSVLALLKDREGDLWAVTTKGIDRFRDLSVLTYARAQHLSADFSGAALVTHDGSIWTTAGPPDILKGTTVTQLSKQVAPPGTRGTSILEARDGAIWLGMENDLYRIAKGSVKRILTEDGRPVGLVGRLAEDKQGNIWISTFKRQVDDTILSFVRPNETIARHFVTKLSMSQVTIPDVDSGIWILDRKGQIAHIEGGKVENVQNALLHDKRIVSLRQGPDGTLYIWCDKGLVLIRGAEGRFIQDSQLGSCEIHASIFDLTGDLWARGNCGLIRIQKDEVEQWWSSPGAKPRQRLVYDGRDGYSGVSGDFSPTLSRSQDGRLCLASGSGLQMVDPAHLYFNPIPPPVVIESVLADHVPVPRLGLHNFAAGTRDLELDYAALSYPNPAKVLFRYKLDGHDQNWQDVGVRRQAIYTNLGPGHYTFRVIACNDSGVWNKQGASMNFSIAPAWYQTLWFHLVSGILVICLLMAAYRIRAKVIADNVELRVSERMSERMRISRELHDTLLQALQGIVLRFSSLTARVSADVQEEMDRSLDDAESLLISGRERIKEMRGTFSEDGNITSDIQGFVTSLFAKQECKVTVEAHGHPIPLNPIAHEEILWIAREALTNSCRHSSAAHLTIQVIYTPRNFRLLMEDDGVGLPSDAFLVHYRGHFGLVSMRERADAIGSRFSVRSEGGKGTKVSLSLPARLAYASRRWWLWELLARCVRRSRT